MKTNQFNKPKVLREKDQRQPWGSLLKLRLKAFAKVWPITDALKASKDISMHRFQNICMTCYRQKSTVIFEEKQPPKGLCRWQGIWVFWLWEELYAKLVAILGYNPSNELCGRLVASKLSAHKADGLFLHPNNQQRVKEVHQSIWVPVNVQITIVFFKRVLSSAIPNLPLIIITVVHSKQIQHLGR